jgi:hypothetical protein
MKKYALSLILLLIFSSPVFADTIVFDFEDQPATFIPPALRTGALTTLTMTDTESGLSVTITRESDGQFDLVSNTGDIGNQAGKPAAFGLISLDPFYQQTFNTAFILNFSSPITSFSVDMGDYGTTGADYDDVLLLQAYSALNGTGALLDSDSGIYGSGGFLTADPSDDIITLQVAALGINSIRMIGGSSGDYAGGKFPNSMFYDNLTAETTAVPEPTTMLLLGTGLVGLWGLRRKFKK